MSWAQVLGLGVLAVFYGIYFGKMLRQRKQGVQTDQIAKGTKEKQVLRVEALMKAAAYSVVAFGRLHALGRRDAAPSNFTGGALFIYGLWNAVSRLPAAGLPVFREEEVDECF